MKIKYEFVTGETVEVEVTGKVEELMIELDREYKRIKRRETRRHESLDISKESEWCMSKDPTTDVIAEENEAAENAVRKVEKILTPKQFDAFLRVRIEGMTESEYAKMMSISQPVVNRRIYASLKKMTQIF